MTIYCILLVCPMYFNDFPMSNRNCCNIFMFYTSCPFFTDLDHENSLCILRICTSLFSRVGWLLNKGWILFAVMYLTIEYSKLFFLNYYCCFFYLSHTKKFKAIIFFRFYVCRVFSYLNRFCKEGEHFYFRGSLLWISF